MYFDIDVVSKQEFNSWLYSPTYRVAEIIRPDSNYFTLLSLELFYILIEN